MERASAVATIDRSFDASVRVATQSDLSSRQIQILGEPQHVFRFDPRYSHGRGSLCSAITDSDGVESLDDIFANSLLSVCRSSPVAFVCTRVYPPVVLLPMKAA